ncbi:MAG: haloacid dehalogenase-like hydrolase [Rhodocyclaceae bacterium]|nr:haloacid dehalogenase-like hydrolase [Rhodocyclaceae bacterium]MBP6108901.1 haloacid dehalogenase-like hydrolase [Rhodocyclaceae bacterium]MBP6279911.1 haloacid dehalogenase-like hydrolase [Rhodocyclaceae bacterium]
MNSIRRVKFFASCLLLLTLASIAPAYSADALPSWNEGATKQSIVSFVERVTTQSGKDYVAPAERIAVFDNDGTLWSEQPLYFQLFFTFERIRTLAPQHPEWQEKPAVKALLVGDMKAVMASSERDLFELVIMAHAGNTTEDFNKIVKDWVANSRHPKSKRPFTEMVFQPMLELMAYLRANGFKTYICSGGDLDFMRAFAERVYGIPPEQVIGSSFKYSLGSVADPLAIVIQPKLDVINDNDMKPVSIHRAIGRRPIFTFGNSDGDHAMLRWTAAGSGARFMGLVHHTDGEREVAYDRESKIGKLDKALDDALAKGWAVADVKRDWRAVFPPEKK